MQPCFVSTYSDREQSKNISEKISLHQNYVLIFQTVFQRSEFESDYFVLYPWPMARGEVRLTNPNPLSTL